MISLLRTVFRPPASSTTRMMSSLASGSIIQGAKWNYRLIREITKGDATHETTVYKATVDPHKNDIKAPQWAVIKVAHDEDTKRSMGLELACYRLPKVASTPCFRRMYDVIDDSTIALEWLDNTLLEVEYHPTLENYILIKEVLRAALTSCVILGDQGYVNMDYKPSNILVSQAVNGYITAKVGDFGRVLPAGLYTNVPYAMRAPEIFLGEKCTPPSQVWAVGAMLLTWMKPSLLGVGGCPRPEIDDFWCLMKMKQLFLDQTDFPTDDPNQLVDLKIVREFIESQTPLRIICPFEEEAKRLGLPEAITDILRLMLVVDVGNRPSASSILESAEFQALEKFVEI
ncbi:kinase-like domain-containing protein [Annulohypoxylon nitens]|nr:kinase-like domain-containing protein [Annulohypoxylon nitens]